MNRRRILAACAAGALLLGVGACADEDGSGDSSMTVIKIGLAMPLTGPSSTNAVDLIRYAEYGIEDANKALAEHNIKLEIVAEDTAGTAEQGVIALNKLANIEKTPIVLTAYSAVVNAVAPLAEDLGVAVVNIGAQSPRLAGASPNLINFFPLATVNVAGIAAYLKEQGKTRAGVIYVDNEGGIAPAEAFKSEFQATGGTVVGMEPVRPGAPDASTPVAKLLALNPEAVYFQTLQPETPAVMQALRASGRTDIIIATHSGIAEDTEARKATGDRMNGVVYSTLVPQDSPALQAVVDRFKNEKKREPSLLSLMPYEYDFGFLVGEIVKKITADGQRVTGANIIKAIKDAKTFKTPLLGDTAFAENLTITAPIVIKQINSAGQPSSTDTTVRAQK